MFHIFTRLVSIKNKIMLQLQSDYFRCKNHKRWSWLEQSAEAEDDMTHDIICRMISEKGILSAPNVIIKCTNQCMLPCAYICINHVYFIFDIIEVFTHDGMRRSGLCHSRPRAADDIRKSLYFFFQGGEITIKKVVSIPNLLYIYMYHKKICTCSKHLKDGTHHY